MEVKTKVIQIFNNNPQRIQLRGRPKTDGGIVYKQILTNAKLRTGKKGQKRELSGRRSLRSSLDCSAIE
jgi:hypothetical protein